MAISPFDHPLLSGLLGDDAIAVQFSAQAEIDGMAAFEAALAQAEAAEGIIPANAAEAIALACHGFVPDFAAINHGAARDGVIGVEFVRQLRAVVGAPNDRHVHLGATSQDLTDTSLVLRLRPVLEEFETRLRAVKAALDELETNFGGRRMMGRTRMQEALPITAADRIASWRGPMERHLERLPALRPRLMVLQFGGAVGTLDKLGALGPAVARRMAEALELGLPEQSWHSQRDNLGEFAGWLSLVSGSLGKIGADITLMAQNAVGEIVLEGGGGSSAMPHKSNPVKAEVLVALARFNAVLAGGMHQALVHEQERSGAAWTLEWLILPQMVVATAAGLRTALALLGQIEDLGERP
jgi:3-carboxy-cis,cis-muconate cycloisomerase